VHTATDALLSPHVEVSGSTHATPERSLRATGINGMSVGWCFVDVGSAVTYIAQAGWLIDLAAVDCEVTETEEQKAVCAADASAIIGAFTNVVSYIAGAASLCSNTLDLRGLCTADIGTFMNALAGLAASGAVLQQTCSFEEPLMGGQFADPGSREEPPPPEAATELKEAEDVASGEALVKEVLPGAKFV